MNRLDEPSDDDTDCYEGYNTDDERTVKTASSSATARMSTSKTSAPTTETSAPTSKTSAPTSKTSAPTTKTSASTTNAPAPNNNTAARPSKSFLGPLAAVNFDGGPIPRTTNSVAITAFFLNLRGLRGRKDDIVTVLGHMEQDANMAGSNCWTENSHHFIADMFPTVQRSRFNSESPVVDEDTINMFCNNDSSMGKVMRSRYRRGFVAMVKFYGVDISCTGKNRTSGGLNYTFKYPPTRAVWLSYWNHNFMRITRILESLKVLQFDEELKVFSRILALTYMDHKGVIGETTWKFWREHFPETAQELDDGQGISKRIRT